MTISARFDHVARARSSLGNLLGHEPGSQVQATLASTQVTVESALELLRANIARTPHRGDLQAGAERISASGIKRAVDVVGAALLLVFLAPLLIMVMVIIRLESPGPVLFKQRRTGHRGAPFVIYKFRTMTVAEDGDAVVQARLQDQRITAFGRILRRSSIDELPQLINVLRGEMALVGPRPHALAHDRFYSSVVSQYYLRFLAKPGISGLAQVCGSRGPTPTAEAMATRIELDLDYIQNWSVKLDFAILVETLLSCFVSPAAF